jgi:hypothetical protein
VLELQTEIQNCIIKKSQILVYWHWGLVCWRDIRYMWAVLCLMRLTVDFSGPYFPLRKFCVLFFNNLWNISIMNVRFAGLLCVCNLLFTYNLIKRELLILILKQRTVGKLWKYSWTDFGCYNQCTRRSKRVLEGAVNGFGGKVVCWTWIEEQDSCSEEFVYVIGWRQKRFEKWIYEHFDGTECNTCK